MSNAESPPAIMNIFFPHSIRSQNLFYRITCLDDGIIVFTATLFAITWLVEMFSFRATSVAAFWLAKWFCDSSEWNRRHVTYRISTCRSCVIMMKTLVTLSRQSAVVMTRKRPPYMTTMDTTKETATLWSLERTGQPFCPLYCGRLSLILDYCGKNYIQYASNVSDLLGNCRSFS